MGKWNRFRRKKKTASNEDSESTGKVGQPLGPGQSALQPSYLKEPGGSDTAHGEQHPRERHTPRHVPQHHAAHRQEGEGGAAERHSSERHAPERRIQKIHLETQPESPSLPPAPAELATGKPAGAPRGVVVLAIGLPGSGKTTWFKRRGVTPLSSDMLRTLLFDDITEQRYQSLVFSTLRSLLRARLIARMPWNYVDATNLSPKERKQWIQMARQLGYEVQAVFFDVPLEVCLERNRRRERTVAEDVMRRMAAKLRPPAFEEGFSKIVVVRVKSKEGSETGESEF
jgi:predicted kinase